VPIEFNQAILVAFAGLVVNGISLVILGGHGHFHDEADDHGHDHDHHDDHNLWSAYLHVLADAMTSVLAIVALGCGKYFGWRWLDPFMGIVGAGLIVNWSQGLLRSSGRVLLDMQAPDDLIAGIKTAIEREPNDRVSDLHLWAVGPGIYAGELVIVSAQPRDADAYRGLIPSSLPLVHLTVEVRRGAG
jgi:cation diffusion facilitator family transporter